MKIIRADAAGFAEFFSELRQRGGTFTPELLASVAEIIRDVTVKGDEALFEYTAKFDGHEAMKRCSNIRPNLMDMN